MGLSKRFIFGLHPCRLFPWLQTVGIAITLMVPHLPLPVGADEAVETTPQDVNGPSTALRLKEQADAVKAEQHAVGSQLLQEFPDDFDALRVMGYVHSSHGNLDEMFACWRQCLALEPNRADVYDQLGQYALQAEKYDDAIGYWQQARKIDPKMPGVLANIGNALLNLGRAEDAARALQQEIKIAPMISQTHFLLGEAFFQLRDFSQAKSSYRRAVQLEPNHAKAVYGLVKVTARLGEREEAAAYSQQFQQLEAATGQSDQEYRRQYDDLRQMREKLASTCTDAGRVYLRHKNTRKAEQLWTRAAAVDSQNTACRLLLASLYTKQRKAADALRQYQELRRIEPKNVEHYQKIGFLQARLGKLADAESAFRKMVEIAPRNAAGYRALAKFYLNTNREAELAQKLADKAVQLDPVADSHFVLGWALAKNGNRRQALTELQTAMQLNPDSATYRQLYEAVRGNTAR